MHVPSSNDVLLIRSDEAAELDGKMFATCTTTATTDPWVWCLHRRFFEIFVARGARRANKPAMTMHMNGKQKNPVEKRKFSIFWSKIAIFKHFQNVKHEKFS